MYHSRIRRFAHDSRRIQSASPLDNSQIARVAPSVFATEKHESRSERYTHIPTSAVLDGLRGEGFMPYFAMQANCRIPGKGDFTKHMLRLRREGSGNISECPEVVLINSHDGTSAYQLFYGVIRFICNNGLFVAEDGCQEIKVPHKGDVVGHVIEGAYEVIAQSDRVLSSIDSMKALTLSNDEQRVFAESALVLRFPDAEQGRTPFRAERLLDARRREDRDDTLWTTFNRVQENAIQGGISGRSAVGRRTTTREITGIAQNVTLNRALWQLAEGMRAIKNGGEVRLAA